MIQSKLQCELKLYKLKHLVKNLKNNGKTMIKKERNIFKFTDEQKEILIGLLLGDGHLEQMSLVTYRLKVEQSADKEEYLYHLYDIFKDYCGSKPILKIKSNGDRSLMFQTKTSISLNFYGKQFYRDKIKIIPIRLLHRWLTPKVLAY